MAKYVFRLFILLPIIMCWCAFNECVEAIRYLDTHPYLPDGSAETLKTSYDTLLVSLASNASLAANKLSGKANAQISVNLTTRALAKESISDSDKGSSSVFLSSHVMKFEHNIIRQSALPPCNSPSYT